MNTISDTGARDLIRFVMQLEQNSFRDGPDWWDDKRLAERLSYWLISVLRYAQFKETLIAMSEDGELVLETPEPFSGRTCRWRLAEISDMPTLAMKLANNEFGHFTSQLNKQDLTTLRYAAFWGEWNDWDIIDEFGFIGPAKKLVELGLINNDFEYAKKWSGSPIKATCTGNLYAQILREYNYLDVVEPRVKSYA